MAGFLLPLLLVTSHLVLCGAQTAQTNLLFNNPLSFVISPKIWNLLDTKADLITKYVKSIRLADTSSNDTMLDYRVKDVTIEDFSVPKSGVSFKEINSGIHLRVKDIKFRAVARAKVAVGVQKLKASMKGDVKVNCNYAELDVELKWDDYEITPFVIMKADLDVKFTESLKAANLFKDKIREYSDHFVSNQMPKMIEEMVRLDVNPMLRKLKNMLAGMGLSQFGVEFMVQNGALRVAVKPKSALGKVDPIKPVDKMVCISSELLAALRALKRSKRQVKSSDKTKLGIDVVCPQTPQGECTETSCSYCADLDIKPSTTKNGFSADFTSCMPKNL